MWLIVALIGPAAAALQAQPEAVSDGTDNQAQAPAAVEESVVDKRGSEPRRDPFRPFTLDLRPEIDESIILTPLQR